MSELQAKIPSASKIRDELLELVIKDLLGPAGGPDEEIAESSVRDRYLVGMLAAKKQIVGAEEFDEPGAEGTASDEDGKADFTAPQSTTILPSSFGISFSVDGNANALKVTARWGKYEWVESEIVDETREGKTQKVWKRTPIECVLESLPLKEGTIEKWQVNADEEVYVQGVVRKRDSAWSVTLFLVNEQEEPKQKRDSAWIFQPELIVESSDGAAIFCKRQIRRDPSGMDPAVFQEEQSMEMIYRKHVEFAIGHGVGVHWECDGDDRTRAKLIRTARII